MRKKILIIENDTDIREIVSYVLEGEDYEVTAVNYGPASLFSEYKADLILLDEWINLKEGHMLCNEIKQIHQIQHIPVIILSTAPNIEAIAARCKADGFIRKPFDLEGVINEVDKCLSANNLSVV